MPQPFVIVFFGLIAHFSLAEQPTSERAVLVRHENHKPYLFLRSADIRSKIPSTLTSVNCPKLPDGANPFPGPGPVPRVQCFDLTRVHLKIPDLPSTTPFAFDSHIPRLSKITNGKTPKPEVTNASGGHAFLDYPRGCVSAPVLSNPGVSWSDPDPSVPNCKPSGYGPGCIAAYSAYESTPSAKVIKIYADGQPFTVVSTAVVIVANFSQTHHTAKHPKDYKSHLQLIYGKCIQEMNRLRTDCTEKPDNICRGSRDIGNREFEGGISISRVVARYNLEVECSQSQNPPPP